MYISFIWQFLIWPIRKWGAWGLPLAMLQVAFVPLLLWLYFHRF